MLAAFTDMNPAEMWGLQWKQVDLADSAVNVDGIFLLTEHSPSQSAVVSRFAPER
jgi:hypothetical protein